MDVLQQHRRRIGRLRQALDRLIVLHRDLHDKRNEMLAHLAGHEQQRRQPVLGTSADLEAITAQIDALRGEAFGTASEVSGTRARARVESFSPEYSIWLDSERPVELQQP